MLVNFGDILHETNKSSACFDMGGKGRIPQSRMTKTSWETLVTYL